jgi:Outer membrane protein beta-barrel domain
MKAIRKKVLIIFIGLMVCAGFMQATVRADAKDYKCYAMVGLGANIPTGGLDDAGYDNGFTTWVTYGRNLSEYLAVEGTFSYFYTEQDTDGTTAVAGNYSRKDRVGVSAVLVTVKGQFPVGPVVLFGGAGVGGYYVSWRSEIDTSTIGEFDVDDEDSVWGAHVVTGATWDLNKRVFFGAQALYRWTDDVNIDKFVGTVPVRFKGDLNGYTVTVAGGFRF